MHAALFAIAASGASALVIPRQDVVTANGTEANVDVSAAIAICGAQPYFEENYTCYDNEFLCPVINNRRTQACSDACFDPEEYK